MHTKVSLSTSWQLYPSPLSMGQGTMPTWWWHVMQWCAHRHLHGIGTEKPAPQWCRHVSTDCGAVSCKWPLSTCFLSASSSGDVSLPSSPEKSGARLDSNLAWTSLEHYSYSVALNYGCTKKKHWQTLTLQYDSRNLSCVTRMVIACCDCIWSASAN